MKNRTSSTTLPVKAEPLTPEVMPPLGEIEEPDYTKPAERINFHLGMAQHHGRLAIAHVLVAGWELANQKQSLGYGAWASWCEKSLDCTRLTAHRYIQFFCKAIGERRADIGIPLANRLTNKDLETATAGMEGKSVRAAMIDLGIIAKQDPEKEKRWGGPREGAGRKSKRPLSNDEVAAALDEVKASESICWGIVKSAIENLGKKNVFRNLSDEHLSEAIESLESLLKSARGEFDKRLEVAS